MASSTSCTQGQEATHDVADDPDHIGILQLSFDHLLGTTLDFKEQKGRFKGDVCSWPQRSTDLVASSIVVVHTRSVHQHSPSLQDLQ